MNFRNTSNFKLVRELKDPKTISLRQSLFRLSLHMKIMSNKLMRVGL